MSRYIHTHYSSHLQKRKLTPPQLEDLVEEHFRLDVFLVFDGAVFGDGPADGVEDGVEEAVRSRVLLRDRLVADLLQGLHLQVRVEQEG